MEGINCLFLQPDIYADQENSSSLFLIIKYFSYDKVSQIMKRGKVL